MLCITCGHLVNVGFAFSCDKSTSREKKKKKTLLLQYSLLTENHCFVDVIRSAIGFTVFTALLSSWALTFAIGGEHLFGPVWDQLVMYNLADRLGLTSWS